MTRAMKMLLVLAAGALAACQSAEPGPSADVREAAEDLNTYGPEDGAILTQPGLGADDAVDLQGDI